VTAELLAADELSVTPDYRMFGVGEAPAGFGDSPPVPGAGWLGVGHASVLIGVVDGLGRPDLRVELWDGEPPQPVGYDVQHTVGLQLPTGRIALDLITGGGVDIGLGLTPGLYATRVTGWRAEPEHYLIQFWLKWASAELVRTEGSQIQEGYHRFCLVDSAVQIREVLPVHHDWLAVGDAFVQVRHGEGTPVVRLELWDGPPPRHGSAQVREPFRLSLPSGRLDVWQLRDGPVGIREIRGGSRPLGTIPPGDYEVSLTKHDQNYLVCCWPVSS
jgi:hypothetical protein